MRISELSWRSGVPVATIKYYLREGLLHPGELTAATQAQYDDGHVHRLRLVRGLVEVGQLSLAAAKRVLDAVDDDTVDLHQLLGTACRALGPDATPEDGPEWALVRAEVDGLLEDLGWRVTAEAPGRDQLTRAVLTLRRLGAAATTETIRRFAEAAHSLAAYELSLIDSEVERGELVEAAVIGTVLFEPVLLALRRLAEEDESARRFT